MKVTLSRANHLLLFFILLTVVLYYGRPVLIPVIFAAMLAMLMAPVCRVLDKKLPRAISCLLCVLILLVLIGGIITIVSAQVSRFSNDLPRIEEKFNVFLGKIQYFIDDVFDMSPEEQMAYVKRQTKALGESAGAYFGMIVGGVIGMVANVAITLVMTFLMLYNKEMYETFFIKIYREEGTIEVKKVLADVTKVSQQYLTGRAISMSIQAGLFSVGLLIIGIENAILLGVIAGLLSIFPYIGPYLGGLFPILMSLVTQDSLETTAWVVVLLVVVQTFDNYFVEPRVVGGEVNLSALATIVFIIIGGFIWGIVGMILFIPMLGIAKIVFEHVPPLKPYAYLIGDPSEKKPARMKEWLKGLFNKGSNK